MSVTVHQRPGVYSSYDASSVISGSGTGGMVGLAAVSDKIKAGEITVITSYDRAAATFGAGGEEGIAGLIRLALYNGASAVAVSAAASAGEYEAAFAALEAVENIDAVICDSTDQTVQQKLRDSVVQASQARRERVAVIAGPEGETVSALIERAGAINHERVVLVAPGALGQDGQGLSGLAVAAAAAGAIAGETDPAVPLGGAELKGLHGLAERYEDNELDQLILGGVTPVESVGGTVSVVRGITTRTKTGEAADSTWRDLSTIRVADNVIAALRSVLRSRFRRAKNTQQSRSAIRAQVVLELENKLAREIIAGYEDVAVTADTEDPSRCLVEFSFTVAHGINQIWLTAHITV